MRSSGLAAFLKAVEDFGNMSTGEFRRKYPDCDPHEGYGYIQKWGRQVAKGQGSPDIDRSGLAQEVE